MEAPSWKPLKQLRQLREIASVQSKSRTESGLHDACTDVCMPAPVTVPVQPAHFRQVLCQNLGERLPLSACIFSLRCNFLGRHEHAQSSSGPGTAVTTGCKAPLENVNHLWHMHAISLVWLLLSCRLGLETALAVLARSPLLNSSVFAGSQVAQGSMTGLTDPESPHPWPRM